MTSYETCTPAGPRGRRAGRRAALLLATLLAPAGGCNALDKLLEAEPRSRIPAQIVEAPENAALLVNGAIADFECAAGAYVVVSALIGEELVDATQTADRFPYDRRDVQPRDRRYSTFGCEAIGVYTPLQTARSSADRILGFLEGWTDAQVPNRMSLLATAAAYAGYSYLLIGEGFCSAAFSTIDEAGNIVYGGEVERDSILRIAEARFTQAIEAAEEAENTDILRMARVGRARTRLNLGRLADARADAALLPQDTVYVKNISASAAQGRRENRVWSQNSTVTQTTTSVGEPYRALNDPRVPTTSVRDSRNQQRFSTTGVPLWRQDKYPTAATAIPLATGDEARLMIAEADIAANTATSLANAQSIINSFRARGNQAALTTTDPAALRAALIEQRRRELFLEGHHLGDVIRYELTLRPAAGATFPGGGTYGSQKCMPLPDVERQNNPEIPG